MDAVIQREGMVGEGGEAFAELGGEGVGLLLAGFLRIEGAAAGRGGQQRGRAERTADDGECPGAHRDAFPVAGSCEW